MRDDSGLPNLCWLEKNFEEKFVMIRYVGRMEILVSPRHTPFTCLTCLWSCLEDGKV